MVVPRGCGACGYFVCVACPRGRTSGPRPLPLVFSRELQGTQVQELAQKGLEEATIRQWLLASGLR